MSDMNITYQEYWAEVRAIAEQVSKEVDANDSDLHDTLHEMIDAHQWIIYYGYNTDVLKHSDNDNAYFTEGLGPLTADSANAVLQQLAFAAFMADVQEALASSEVQS